MGNNKFTLREGFFLMQFKLKGRKRKKEEEREVKLTLQKIRHLVKDFTGAFPYSTT